LVGREEQRKRRREEERKRGRDEQKRGYLLASVASSDLLHLVLVCDI